MLQLISTKFEKLLRNRLFQYKKLLPYGVIASEFASADRNGDGIVTIDEFCAWLSHRK